MSEEEPKVLRFKTKRQEIPVEMEGEDGEIEKYILREMGGKMRATYVEGLASNLRFGPKGNAIGLKSFKGLESNLLKLTLFNPEDKAVTVEEIDELPSSVVEALFSESQTLNGLDKQGIDDAKND